MVLRQHTVSATSFNPQLLAQFGPVGYGLEVYQWDISSLQAAINSAKKNQPLVLLLGYGFTCRTFVQKNTKLPTKKERPKWVSDKKDAGFDSVQLSTGNIVIWEPYCLYATHRISLDDSQLRAIFASMENKSQFLLTSEFINFTKPETPNIVHTNSHTTATADDFHKAAQVLEGTLGEGCKISNCWDMLSLGVLDQLDTDNQKELETKLLFSYHVFHPGKLITVSPFAGKNCLQQHMQASPQQHELKLLLCLELLHNKMAEADKYLKEYIEAIQASNYDAHPLLLLAIARLLGPNHTKYKECLAAFTCLYAASSWLTKDEAADVKHYGKSLNVSTSLSSTPCSLWDELKRKEGCTSKAMDDLLALTGLARVKQSALDMFKTALKIAKMPPKQQKQALSTFCLNYVFLGNPGTGKTTVARLFAQILKDSKIRSKGTFVECSAQKVKDDGPGEFRKLITNALDGVLFIDEAYDLDPKGDFKGKPIVTELLTNAENYRERISIILAGYQDDMNEKFFSYNEGLKSRFQEVQFEDFNEAELKAIWISYAEGIQCDEKIANVVSKRLVLSAGKKGFGNARAVRKMFGDAFQRATSRDNWDNEILIPDVIGEPPTTDNSKLKQVLADFDEKIGWASVKKSVQQMMDLAEENYKRELNGQSQLPFSLNKLFLGNPGTGKTTCAKMYGKLLKSLGVLSNGDVVERTASDFVGSVVGESSSKTSQIIKNAAGKVLLIDEAYALNDNMYGKQVLDTLVEKIQGTPSDDIAVLLLGYETQMKDMIRTQNPGLARRFPVDYAFRFDDYSDLELLSILMASCKSKNIDISSEVAEKAIQVLARQRQLPNFGNAGAVKLLLDNAVAKAASRSSGSGSCKLELEDIETSTKKIDDPFSLLDSLCNVDNIRKKLQQLSNSLTVAKREGGKEPDVGHFIFCGPPGTGKTTVARVMAKILFGLELIATDTIVETSGLDLTGEYLGQTKKKVEEKMSQAKGGVLFIDEAYELGKGHYGTEAMTTLLAGMTDPNYKGMVIIIAGYVEDINEMLDLNVGLKSRFTQQFDFLPWSPEQSFAFFETQLAEKEAFKLKPECKEILVSAFKKLIYFAGWGNGRDVTQLWKDTKLYRSDRVANITGRITKDVETTDVLQATQAMLERRERSPSSSSPPSSSSSSSSSSSQKRDMYPMLQQFAPPRQAQQTATTSRTSKTTNQATSQAKSTSEEKEEEDKQVKSKGIRDAGVSDEIWAELEKAKEEHEERLQRLKQLRSEEERKEEERKERELQEKIRKIVPCPMGYNWLKVGGGWRCAGGSHFVSDKQLVDQFSV